MKKNKKIVKRKVICVWGKFDNKSDFVLEPVCSEECDCEVCKDAFWIENCKEVKIHEKPKKKKSKKREEEQEN